MSLTAMLKVSHVVNSVFTSKTYFLSEDGNTEFWVVDCGDIPPIVDSVSSFGGSSFVIKGVLLTHVHYDHIYGLPKLMELFPEMKVYTNDFGKMALADERLNYSKYHDDPIIIESENVTLCDEGAEIGLFDGVTAKVCYTSGHNPSCLTYEVGDYLFTGDAYIPGIKVVTTFKGGDKMKAAESVERIKTLAEGKIICPGHEV